MRREASNRTASHTCLANVACHHRGRSADLTSGCAAGCHGQVTHCILEEQPSGGGARACGRVTKPVEDRKHFLVDSSTRVKAPVPARLCTLVWTIKADSACVAFTLPTTSAPGNSARIWHAERFCENRGQPPRGQPTAGLTAAPPGPVGACPWCVRGSKGGSARHQRGVSTGCKVGGGLCVSHDAGTISGANCLDSPTEPCSGRALPPHRRRTVPADSHQTLTTCSKLSLQPSRPDSDLLPTGYANADVEPPACPPCVPDSGQPSLASGSCMAGGDKPAPASSTLKPIERDHVKMCPSQGLTIPAIPHELHLPLQL